MRDVNSITTEENAILPIVTRSVAKPVVHNTSSQDYSLDDNPINPKVARRIASDDNGFAIQKSKDNVKRMANKFDNKAPETPSPIKSTGLKNRYTDDEDGGEGSFDNLIKYKHEMTKQFDQFGRRLQQQQPATTQQPLVSPMTSTTGYDSIGTAEISTASSITSFNHDEHDMYASRYRAEEPTSGFKRTTSFDNFNEINYTKPNEQTMKKGRH